MKNTEDVVAGSLDPAVGRSIQPASVVVPLFDRRLLHAEANLKFWMEEYANHGDKMAEVEWLHAQRTHGIIEENLTMLKKPGALVWKAPSVQRMVRCWGWATKEHSTDYTMGFDSERDALCDARATIGEREDVWIARGRRATKDDQDAPPEAMECERWYFAEDETKQST